MPGGRPSSYSPEVGQQVYDIMAKGFSITAAAGEIGVAAETIHNWARENPEFSATLHKARAARVRALEGTMLETTSGAVVGARKFALINAQRLMDPQIQDWAPEGATVTMQNPDGTPINSDPMALAASMLGLVAQGQEVPDDADE